MNTVIISGKISGEITCEYDKHTTTTKFKLLNQVYSGVKSSMLKTIVRCICYGAVAEYVQNELYDGCNVICTGRIQYRRYISNNQPIDIMYVCCNTVSILEQEEYS
jgi:single-stranded DNA-binding protein